MKWNIRYTDRVCVALSMGFPTGFPTTSMTDVCTSGVVGVVKQFVARCDRSLSIVPANDFFKHVPLPVVCWGRWPPVDDVTTCVCVAGMTSPEGHVLLCLASSVVIEWCLRGTNASDAETMAWEPSSSSRWPSIVLDLSPDAAPAAASRNTIR